MNGPGAPQPWQRRPHLDWLRGIAVLIMIEAHAIDSWTRAADRTSSTYQWATVVAGFGAPAFLFLAGITLMLAAVGRQRRGLTATGIALGVIRRGGWILVLAFLFRLQSVVISGAPLRSLLKVDILNIMAISIAAGGVVLAVATTFTRRVAAFVVLTVVVAMATPLVRETPMLDGWPDALEAYFRPRRGLTTFTLFPWAAFFTAGCAVGAWLGAQTKEGARLNLWLAVAGGVLAIGGYGASFLPPLYPEVSFWTSSPTFFFLRLGILLAAVPVAFAICRRWPGAALQEFGRASLFVYWIHVELVYGVPSAAIHRSLPFPIAVFAFAAFSASMFGLVRLKSVIWQRRAAETVQST